jgi:hypothetical protein
MRKCVSLPGMKCLRPHTHRRIPCLPGSPNSLGDDMMSSPKMNAIKTERAEGWLPSQSLLAGTDMLPEPPSPRMGGSAARDISSRSLTICSVIVIFPSPVLSRHSGHFAASRRGPKSCRRRRWNEKEPRSPKLSTKQSSYGHVYGRNWKRGKFLRL